ncbi:ornithine cyclodeaminase [Rhizobium sp. CF142]|uniref:ornithine cyclodeaminase n=1 Tax=Rhizobium sp. CF142 TaxID=1144314 RepID=UPI00026EF4F6|nr:ornithine cyclodeaminase [Rhizobium sp. CF142]EJJ27108.1 putative ornithine cyclodeaminase, mu-crystallin [Rhizobium sp. CF142]
MNAIRHLSRADAIEAGALDWTAAIEDVHATLRLLRDGKAGMVAESVIPLGADPRYRAYGLPAFVGGVYDATGLKWTVHRAEPVGDLPSISSTTFINRLTDGAPLGTVESALLTRMRTVAVSAAAIRGLMPNALKSVTILGAGAQAQTHLDMLRSLFPDLGEVHLWNRTRTHLDTLIEQADPNPITRLIPHDRLHEALENADVILCCTSAPEPFLDASAVGAGRLIMQIGFNEVKFETIAATDFVTVDLWGDFADKSAKSLFQMYRAGQFAPSRVAADLPAIVLDGWQPPTGASLYFSSFGLNVFDIAFAARLLRRANELGIGTVMPAI